MEDNDDEAPTVRALRRHLALISAADDVPRGTGFDPWAHAEARRERFERGQDARVRNRWAIAQRRLTRADDAYVGPVMRRPVLQSSAAWRVLELQRDIEAGDGAALMEAVCTCAVHFLVMPAWLAAEFSRRWHAVQHGEAGTWDDAFGKAVPTADNRAANRRGVRARTVLAPWAYEVACAALQADPGRPIDAGLWEEVGLRVGLGHTQAEARAKEFERDASNGVPPLSYVKARCAEGLTAMQARVQWDQEQFDAALRANGWTVDPRGRIAPVQPTGDPEKG